MSRAVKWLSLAAGFLLLGIAIVLVFINLIISDAWGHSWYDAACCSGKDCAVIPDANVSDLGEGGFYIHSLKKHIAFKDTRQGRDSNYHLCVHERTGVLLCFYRKFQGS